jgi:hypothetical protein
VVPDVFSRQKAYFVLAHDQDSRNSQIGAYASINSYNIEEVRFISFYHSYGTDWGLDRGDLNDSRLAADREADRASGSFVGRRAGRYTAGLPSTALLTLIFLQQFYKAELPSLSYLTFLDCLHAYSYIVSLVLSVLFLWGNNVFAKADDEGKGERGNCQIDARETQRRVGDKDANHGTQATRHDHRDKEGNTMADEIAMGVGADAKEGRMSE